MPPPGLLYHANRAILAPGASVQPGTCSRIIAATGISHPHWAREEVLESIRTAEFAEKPSRLRAAFACLDLGIARHYRAAQCAEGNLYEVEIVDPSLPWHVGDFNAVQPLLRTTHTAKEAARRYWQHLDRCTVVGWGEQYRDELLTLSPLRVLRQI